MSCAAPLSSDTALMALPAFVLLTKSVSKIIMTMFAMMVNMDSGDMTSSPPARRIGSIPLNRLVNILGLAPQMSRAMFCRKYETPIAVISTASEPVPLSGLYARRSMSMPRHVHTAMATRRATQPFMPTFIVMMNEI